MGEMNAKKYHPKKHNCIEEIHYVDEGRKYDASHTVRIVDLKNIGKVLLFDCRHGEMEGEKQDGGGEVDQKIGKVKIENLHLEKNISPPHLLTLVLVHFLLYLLKGKVATIDPSLTLTHQSVDSLDGIHLCICIRHKNDVFFVFVNTHTQNTILCQINVLIVKYLFFRVRVDWSDVFPDDFWQKYSHEHVASCEGAWNNFI